MDDRQHGTSPDEDSVVKGCPARQREKRNSQTDKNGVDENRS